MTMHTIEDSGDGQLMPAAAPSSNRSGLLVVTVASSWLRTLATLVIGLVTTPLLVRYLGPERLGAARIAEQWFGYLEFLRLGLGSAIGVLLVEAATSGSGAGACGVARAGFFLQSRQLRWILPAAALLALAFPPAFGLPAELGREFYSGVPAILVGIVLGPGLVFRSLLEARQRGYLVNAGLIAQAAVTATLGVSFAAAGFGLAGQLWSMTFGSVAFIIACAYLAGGIGRRFWSHLTPTLSVGELRRLRWPLLVTGIAGQINMLSDNIIAGSLLGVSDVAILVLSQRLFQLGTTVAGSVSGPGTWASLVDIRVSAGVGAFHSRLSEVTRLNLGLNLIVLAPVLACNRRFVGLWVGDSLYAGDSVTLATFAQLALFSFFLPYSSVIDALGWTERRVVMSTFGTIVKIVLVAPLVLKLGLAGLPLASLVGSLCAEAWYCPLVLRRGDGVPTRSVLVGVTRAAVVGGTWAAACYLIGNRTGFTLHGWGGLLIEATGLEVLGLAIGWFVLLPSNDRRAWRARIRSWLRRRQGQSGI